MKLFITGTSTEVGKSSHRPLWRNCYRWIIEKQQQKKIEIDIIFSGDEHPTTEEVILIKTKVAFLGRINEEPRFDKVVILEYATKFQHALLHF